MTLPTARSPRPSPGSRYLAALAAAAPLLLLPLASGCESRMEPKECDKLRSEAFDLLNVAQHCNNDTECRASDWPGCSKPLSNASHDKIKPMRDSFQKGKCEEPASTKDCKPAPEVYCKQGLCVHREKGVSEGSGNTPTDQIIVK
jgi:hypothetical protein